MPDMYHLIQCYGYGLLFIILLAGTIGFPIPDEGVLMFAGALLAIGQMEWVPVLGLSIPTVLLGTLFNYWVAIHCREGILVRIAKRCKPSEGPWQKAVNLIQKYGVLVVPLSYFIPGIRISVSYAAGLGKLPILPFTLSATAGVLCWVSLYLWLGFLAGSTIR